MPFTNQKSKALAKEAAGREAAGLIEEGMIVGLGTGSTAAYFIQSLIEKVKKGLKITAVSSSRRSSEMAKEGGIPVVDINDVDEIDITVDGADEIDDLNRMIKGGGGAHLREKIVATSSKRMVVIVDDSKVVSRLGKVPLPLETAKFGYNQTLNKIKSLGFNPKLRTNDKGDLYTTDNDNYIIDIHFENLIDDPEELDALFHTIPGILETGFFFNLASPVIIGNNQGKVTIRQ